MLVETLKPLGFNTWQKETWEQYCLRLNLPEAEGVREFYRQVVFDHFDHFNEHYPEFTLEDYEIVICNLTAQEANNQIRFFRGEIMDQWGWQYDEYARQGKKYIIYQEMSKLLTFPFPPVLVDPIHLASAGRNACGRPLHLIEGTHRVSYLRHMLVKGLITPSSVHKFVLLKPHA